MGSTKEAEFNPSLFKRSIFCTIWYGIGAAVCIWVAAGLFSTKEFGMGLVDFHADDSIQHFEVSAPHSVLAASLCYVSGFLCLLQGFLLVLMVSTPQFTMGAEYRRHIPVAMATISVLIGATLTAYNLFSIDPLLSEVRDSNDYTPDRYTMGRVYIIGTAIIVIMAIIFGIINAGFAFWALMHPVASRSSMARWLRPFHIRSDLDQHKTTGVQPA